MHKGIKILGKVLSAIILLLIILPLALSLLLDIGTVQNFVVRKAADMVSKSLETTVRIDRVDIGLFSKIKVKGFYVEDYGGDTLLYVGSVDAYITNIGIFGGGLTLKRGEIADAKLYLREMPGGEMNIKQIVNRISDPNRKKKGNFQLKLRKASISNMDFCLERLEHRNPEYGIDFGHMHVYGIAAQVDDFTIDGQNIFTTISGLSARERSGFELERLDGSFYLVNGCLGFEDAKIKTSASSVDIPSISLAGTDWAEYKDFIGQVRIEGALRNTSVATDDIAYFSPKLRAWKTVFSNVNLDFTGVVSDFTGRIRSLQTGSDTQLAADVAIKGLPDIAATHFDLNIKRFATSAADIDTLASGIGGVRLADNVVRILGNAGTIEAHGQFKGLLSSFDMTASASTDVGSLTCKMQIEPHGGGISGIRGDVATSDIKLGQLLGNTGMWGNAAVSGHIDGVIGGGADVNIIGDISHLGLNDYIYDSIRLDGHLYNRRFDGRITSRDSNLDFDFAGLMDFNDSIPRYDFTMNLRHADLARLNINRRDSVSQLTAYVVANASGRSLDDLNGSIMVPDAVYRYNGKEINSKHLTIKGENSANSKLVELSSDFADVTFRSRTSYREVYEYLKRSAERYLPTLERGVTEREERIRKAAVANGFSLLSVNVKHIDPLTDAIASGLQIADGSSLRLSFNPASDQLSLRASSNYIERRSMLATRLDINALNHGDSLTVYASADDLYAGAVHLPQLSFSGGAKQGRVQGAVGFTDTLRSASGLLSVRAEVLPEPGPDGRIVDIRILPSHITRKEKTWRIFANKIQADTARVVIDRFYVRNNEQDMFITGVASRHRSDSVTLRLRNFDLAPFSQIADRMGYSIEGRTNGSAVMKSVFHAGEIDADILLDSVEVNKIAAPPMRLVSRWDFSRNRAGVVVSNREKQDTLIRGFYVPSQVRYYARLNVDSLDMGLLDPILTGVISETKGKAAVNVVLQGQRRNADLTGEISVLGLSTKVDFTQVAYTMPSAVLKVNGNRFKASDVAIYDPDGNQGRFDIDLSLQHLSNIAYDVRVEPQQMMVLNTTSRDNDYFFGKVYATGGARIWGDKGAVKMVISAATDDNSSFNMPLSNKTNLSYADFVTFKEPALIDTADNISRRKWLFENKIKRKQSVASQMDIELALDVRPNVDVELSVAGNTLRGNGDGTLNLKINPRSNIFEMYGDYTISDGSFLFSLQNIIQKRFVIETGSTIQWTGSPMDARLNIDAVYKLKASLQPLLQGTTENKSAERSVPVECIIHLGERLSNPDITFDVRVPGSDPETQAVVANALATPETVDTQFAYLLLFNSFMAENSSSNIGSSVSAATGLEFISNMVSNLLSNDDYNIVIRYRPKSELTSDEVDFGLSRSLINDRLLVEVEGNYIVDNKNALNSSMSNFMGEAYITYLIDRAGTLKLKAFTQTIDRFDENQGLQETGVGVYFKQDFDNFKDFRRRVKERFTNKKRQARKAARREAERQKKEAERQASDTLRAVIPVTDIKFVPADDAARGEVPAVTALRRRAETNTANETK